jgi:hypothetical protein
VPNVNPITFEKLARKMYEANDPGGLPWVYRGWDVRKAWMDKAQQRRESGGVAAGFHFWQKMKSLFLS